MIDISPDETVRAAHDSDKETAAFVGMQDDDTPSERPSGSPPISKRFGDYELIEEIARGGMGVVYKARQIRLNRIVALKMIRSGQFADDDEVQRFHKEAEAAASLDHPQIVPVFEVGKHAGQHFFSMGYVEGASLADRVKEGPLPPKEAAALLKTVAEAVQYAHEKGIVHRDLKPANVLLQFGEHNANVKQSDQTSRRGEFPSGAHPAPLNPKITDFGLAKQTNADSGLTATGQIMGTPSYMPPEQARGDVAEIGPRSDIYSLGAVLYATLTGRPPFQAATVVQTLEQVLSREPASPRTLNPVVDADVETICLKAMQKDPSQRYASAGEMAADLNRYLENRPILARPVGWFERIRRLCARNPVIAMASAVAIVSLLVGAVSSAVFAVRANAALDVAKEETARANEETVRANEQTARADENAQKITSALVKVEQERDNARIALESQRVALKQTRETIDAYVTTMQSSEFLGDPRFQPLLKSLLKDALAHYLKLIRNHRHSTEGEAELAFSLERVAWIHVHSGDRKQGLAAYREAHALYEKLAKANPASDLYQNALVRLQSNIGWLSYRTGGGSTATFDAYRKALESAKRRYRESPHDEAIAGELTETYNKIGVMHRKTGQPKLAVDAFQKAIDVQLKIAKPRPASLDKLAEYLSNQALTLSDLRQLDQAELLFRRALSIIEPLHRAAPLDAAHRDQLASVQHNLSILLDETGRSQEARKLILASQVIREQLVRLRPNNNNYLAALAATYQQLGNTSRQNGGPQKSLEYLNKALDIRTKLATDNPTMHEYRNHQAETILTIAQVHFALNNTDAAVNGLLQGIAIVDKLGVEAPFVSHYHGRAAVAKMVLAEFYDRLNRPADANRELKRAIGIQQKLVQDNPEVVLFRHRLGEIFQSAGFFYSRTRDLPTALEMQNKALPLRRELHESFPDNDDYTTDFGGNHINIAQILRNTNRNKEALAHYNAGVDLLESVYKKTPKHPNAAPYLNTAHWSRANSLEFLTRYREAVEDWKKAETYGPASMRNFFRSQTVRCLAQSSAHAAAAKLAAETFKIVESDGRSLVTLAEAYAQATVNAKQDKSLPAADREKVVESYFIDAARMLKRAETTGYMKSQHWQHRRTRSTLLEPLRHRKECSRFFKAPPTPAKKSSKSTM